LELLRKGDAAGHAALLSESSGQETRLKSVLDETARILSELGAPLIPANLEDLEQPKNLRGVMYKHQLSGMSWLVRLIENQASGILADDMGLGKTVQAIALIAYLAESMKEFGPHLIVAPSSVIPHWLDEVRAWLPSAAVIHASGKTTAWSAAFQDLGISFLDGKPTMDRPAVVVVSYDYVVYHHSALKIMHWFCMIVDEGQRLKNHKGRFSETCNLVMSKHRVLLSGTPVQNSLRELWSLMTFVAPHAFSSLSDFEQWFALPAPPKMKMKLDDDNAESDLKGKEADGAVGRYAPAEETAKLLSGGGALGYTTLAPGATTLHLAPHEGYGRYKHAREA
jgi:SNF2 family DNA or RNA helicase